MRRLRSAGRGTVRILEHRSRILKDNPLGDPDIRPLPVYLPPGYEKEKDRRYPVLYDLVGYTGSGPAHTNWRPFDENVPERVDRLIHQKKMGPVIVVFPDLFTSLGGNQYVNSSAIGRYEDVIVKEIVPFVERSLRALPGRRHRGVFGKSSGGYGAIVHGMRRADTWGAVACHSGDLYFEYLFHPEFPKLLNELAKHGRSVPRFLKAFRKKEKHAGGEVHALMTIAMAATYDPDPKAPLGFRLPIDLHTGEIDPKRWRRWLRHDPVRMVDRKTARANLRRLRCLYIDCGTKDQYHLHYGARQLVAKLERYGIRHVYEEFDDDHSSIDYRMDRSLPRLERGLRAGRG